MMFSEPNRGIFSPLGRQTRGELFREKPKRPSSNSDFGREAPSGTSDFGREMLVMPFVQDSETL